MSNGNRPFKTVEDTRASASGILDSKGEHLQGTFRKTMTSEDIIEQIGKHFKEKIDRLNLEKIRPVELQKIWKEEAEWALDLFSRYAQNNPEIVVPQDKVELATKIFLKSENVRIAEYLEARRFNALCLEVSEFARSTQKGSSVKYSDFVSDFASTEENVWSLLKKAGANPRQIRAAKSVLTEENVALLDFGRGLGFAADVEFPEFNMPAQIRKKARLMAQRNLADVLGGVKFLGHFFKQNLAGKPRMNFEEYMDKEYSKKHSLKLQKWPLRRVAAWAVALTALGGISYLFASCTGLIGAEEGQAGTRSSVTKKRRDPVSPAEIELYKNPLFRGKVKDKEGIRTPKFVPIAKHMAKMGLSDDEQQVKVAKILNKLPDQFIRGMDLGESVELAIILRKLSPGVSIQKLADTVVSIQQYIDVTKTKDFAWTLVKSDKAKKGDVTYWIENPPYKKIMTDGWYIRPFPEFLKAGFSENDKLLQRLSATIRRIGVKQGREIVPLPASEQNKLASSLVALYFKGQKNPKIPETYHEDLEFIMGMRSKGFAIPVVAKLLSNFNYEDTEFILSLNSGGFKVPTATSILSQLKFVYKPKHLDKAAEAVLKNLRPGMRENDMRIAIEAHAFEKRGWASKAWKNAPDPRLLDLLTSERDAKKFSSQLRALPQAGYEDAIETLGTFATTWQAEVSTLESKKIAEIIPQVISLARSKAFAHFSPDKRAQILFQVVSRTPAPTRKADPRAATLKHLENTFKGKKPTVAAVLSELDSYLAAE